MAPSAIAVEMEPASLDSKDSKAIIAEQPKRAVHGSEDLTPIQAISHGPITIGGTSFSLISSLLHRGFTRIPCKIFQAPYLWFHFLPSFSKFL
jgi:hypothetical protein